MPRRRIVAVVAVVLALGVAGLAASIFGGTAEEMNVPRTAGLTLRAKEYSFEVTGKRLAPVRTVLRVNNEGGEDHEVAVLRLDDGAGLDEVLDALREDATGATAPGTYFGGPGLVAPRGSSIDGIDLEPGRFVAFCRLTDADGVSHALLGMTLSFDVDAGTDVAAFAGADARSDVRATEFSFAAPTSVQSVTGMRVRNDGERVHEAALVRPTDGATDDLVAAFAAGEEPTAWERVGGAAPVSPGRSFAFSATLEPGRYALVCLLRDPDTGKTHAAAGMVTALDVGVKP